MVTFIVGKIWNDGTLVERMNAEGLPSELRALNLRGSCILYTCSAELLRQMVSQGCPAELITDKTLWEYVTGKHAEESGKPVEVRPTGIFAE